MTEAPPASPVDDVYARRPRLRWLALLAALLAWGFDGVEQGVYSIMTRQALRDIMPAAAPMVDDLNELNARIKDLAAQGRPTTDEAAAALQLGKKIDTLVGPMFSWSLAMWLWGAAVGGVLFGRLGDRHGRVRMLLLAVATYSVFTGLSAFSTHYTHLLAARFFGALGLGGTWPLCVALVVETWPESRRAVLAGSIGAAANVGYLIAGTYSRWMLVHEFTWRWVIGMGFFIGLVSLPFIILVPEPTKWRLSRHAARQSSLPELFSPRYRRATIVGSLLSTVGLLGTWGAFLWLPTYVDQLTEGTAYAATGKATITMWTSTGQIIGGFAGGLLAGWLGNRRSYVLLCVTAWVSVLAVFRWNHDFDLQLKIMATMAAFFVTSFFGWLPKYLPELYPTRLRASGQGFSFNIGRILAGVGVLGTGALVAAFHGNYARGVTVTAGIYLVGLLVIWLAPNTGGRMLDDTAEPAAEPAVQVPARTGGVSRG
ncbi:MAG: MFS transporter [Planctomycetes bacterium]|nr:MFS transporter [Planctomycetota bacterium]